MKDVTKKVVILNNFSSPYISEAIIVLRDYNPKLEGRIIDEAERVVADFLEKNGMKKERYSSNTARRLNKKNKPRLTFAVVVTLCVVAVIGLIHHFTG